MGSQASFAQQSNDLVGLGSASHKDYAGRGDFLILSMLLTNRVATPLIAVLESLAIPSVSERETEIEPASGIRMISTAVLAAALIQPAANTTWWSTEGAKVIQVPGQNLCTLYIAQQKRSVGFLWDRSALAGIVFQDDAWDFPPRQTKAAVRIGATWVSGSADIDWFEATESRDEIIVPLRYFPVESLLSTAGSVSLHRDGADLDVSLDKSKMPKLLDAVQNCRQHLK